jgi:hypothetical protein
MIVNLGRQLKVLMIQPMHLISYSLFNDAVNSSGYIALNWKECERNQSCPNLMYHPFMYV